MPSILKEESKNGSSGPPQKPPQTVPQDGKRVTAAQLALAAIKKLTHKNLLLDKAMSVMLKRTAVRIFFGGETLGETMQRCEQLLGNGVGVIIDYAPPEEGKHKDADYYKRIRQNYLKTIRGCAALRDKMENMSPEKKPMVSVALKLSSMHDYDDLVSLNRQMLHPEERSIDFDARFQTLADEFRTLVSEAKTCRIRAYVDAEKTEINPLIRELCLKAVKADIPVVMTLQAYLKETPDVVKQILELPKKDRPGIKLVRGAYMGPLYQAERQHIWDTKEETDACYNKAAQDLRGEVPALTIASHNQESLDKVRDKEGLDVATLLGMEGGLDISPRLPQSKYVPYPGEGEILGTVPYNDRRATEFISSICCKRRHSWRRATNTAEGRALQTQHA